MISIFFANSRSSASNFKSFSWSLEQFFLTVGQNDFGNKIPFLRIFWLISRFGFQMRIEAYYHLFRFIVHYFGIQNPMTKMFYQPVLFYFLLLISSIQSFDFLKLWILCFKLKIHIHNGAKSLVIWTCIWILILYPTSLQFLSKILGLFRLIQFIKGMMI